MKKLLISILLILFCVSEVFAASSMVATRYRKTTNTLTIKVVCTAHTDGTFTTKQITSSEAGEEYWAQGYVLAHAYAVNSATDDHTNAAVVTITDETTQQLVGASAGDTLTLSQTASAVAYLTSTRSAAQRVVSSKLSIAIADTGSTATVQTLYLVLYK